MSQPQPAIVVRDVSKTYRIYGNPFGRIKELWPWNKRPHHKAVHALRSISFDVMPGQCVGLVGGNGAGKSTLLKILTGTTFPDTGSYGIRGSVASLLELGAGFMMDFTGAENIYMNSAILGIPRREMKRRFHEILEFSELEEFIDAPIRTYSSGMICRLGFSVAVATDPDVLIIDEILSVGDMRFQRKCTERIYDYKQRGKTLFFCSHSLYDVRQICDTAMWLEQGQLRMQGDAVTVTHEYSTWQNKLYDADGGTPDVLPTDFDRELPHIVSATLVDLHTGEPRSRFQPREAVGIRVHVRNGTVPTKIAVGCALLRPDKLILFSASTEMDQVPVDLPTEGCVTLCLGDLRVLSGAFVVLCAVMDEHGFHRYHQIPTSENLHISVSEERELGLVLHEHEWRIEPIPARGDDAVHDHPRN
ncbi:MAG: ATP-binding cassette domain-containing protein [Planctomycetes bacterium]|nr:ATP-binding cassette domain-containing protein [Planctomycetota bacterium]